MRIVGVLIAAGLLVATTTPAAAQSCVPFLAPDNGGARFELATLNKNGVGSWSQFEANYRPESRIPNGPRRPAQWYTYSAPTDAAPGTSPQLFSDRVARPAPSAQPFDASRPDLISVVVTVEASPQVTVTLRTWNNATATFRATCSAGGVLHGSTPDVDYLLFMTRVGPIL
jgi:hypothetical protein